MHHLLWVKDSKQTNPDNYEFFTISFQNVRLRTRKSSAFPNKVTIYSNSSFPSSSKSLLPFGFSERNSSWILSIIIPIGKADGLAFFCILSDFSLGWTLLSSLGTFSKKSFFRFNCPTYFLLTFFCSWLTNSVHEVWILHIMRFGLWSFHSGRKKD